jgi:hypothetical protein
MLKFLLIFVISSTGYAQDLTQQDYSAGEKFGHGILEMQTQHKVRRGKVDEEKINDYVTQVLQEPDGFLSARLLDLTTARIIQRSVAALNRFGYNEEAEKIEGEYKEYYSTFYNDQYFGVSKSIGQHPPMNIWMELVHVVIHIKLGDFWCQYFHTHDLFIINFATPIVLFKTKAFDKVDYLDHFAGKPIGRWSWDHHGLAGVISYWMASAACGSATAGLGLITFICGSISGFVENNMDRYIAPKIGGAIWDSRSGN